MSDELAGLPCGWPVQTETLLNACLRADIAFRLEMALDYGRADTRARQYLAFRARILARDEARRRTEQIEKDETDAAGGLLMPIPEPGTMAMLLREPKFHEAMMLTVKRLGDAAFELTALVKQWQPSLNLTRVA